MDMSMSSPGMADDSPSVLNASGVDFSNDTQAMEFLEEILDDTDLQILGNAFARYFWYGVVIVIGIAFIVNITQKATLLSRLRAAATKTPYPAKPKNVVTKSIATATATFREIAYPQLTPTRQCFWVRVPPFGTVSLLLAYLGFVLGLEFINNNVSGAQHYQALGVRAAWLAVAQVPLVILLAGKNNLIGFITGISYERLNILHRWASRVLLLLATLHFGCQSYGWNLYGLMQMEWNTDDCPPTGIAAYALLLWINLSTFAPLRNLSYEFFVIQHILTFFGFIIAVMMHLPSTALYSRVYIYIPIVLYFLDRLIRTSRFAYNNMIPGRATLTAMGGEVTKIRVSIKHVKQWSPGAHVLLKIPNIGLLQSHPATIASRPSSHRNDLVFILKGHKGFTNRLLTTATSSTTSLLPKSEQESTVLKQTHTVLIDGPYGGSQADFAAFDSVLLIAGSTGVTFTLSLLLDIAYRATAHRLPVRHLRFVWIVKSASWTSWIADELVLAFEQLRNAGVEIDIKVFVTCDDDYIENTGTEKQAGCQCDQLQGPCCCTRIEQTLKTDEAPSMKSNAKTFPDEKSAIANTNPMESSPQPSKAPCCGNKNSNLDATLRSYVSFISGRPNINDLLWQVLDQAEGETGVAVCGPLGLNVTVRNAVARISDERAVHKGTGAQGIYLHAEGFGW